MPSKVTDYAAKAHDTTLTGFLLDIIPDTFLSALTAGSILQTLLVAILFGVALALVGDQRGARYSTRFEQLSLVDVQAGRDHHELRADRRVRGDGLHHRQIWHRHASPTSPRWSRPSTSPRCCSCWSCSALAARLAGFSIFRLIAYLKAELLLVLGTSSSESALPSLIEKMERAGCPKSIVGLVVPTGYSFNLDGTNIYMTLAALFIAQACNVDLSLGEQVLLLGVAMLVSKGAAGVTGAGFITLAATLSIVPSVPVAGMALILGVDRFMSECRSLTNFIGNAVACVIVTHLGRPPRPGRSSTPRWPARCRASTSSTRG